MKRKGKLSNIRAIIELETGYTYRFPTFEVILVLLVYVAFMSSLSFSSFYEIVVSRSPYYNGTNMLGHVDSLINETRTRILAFAFYPYTHLLAMLIPLLVSLSVANCYEDKTLQTFLTYPVRRFTLLAVKASYAAVLPGAIAILSSICAAYFFIPEMESMIWEFTLLVVAMWIFIIFILSVSTLISILSRRITIAAVGGIAFWYSVQLLINLGGLPQMYSQLLNPLGTTISFISATGSATMLFTDLVFSLIGTLIIGVVILSVCFALFERAEI